MSSVCFENVSKKFGNVTALDGVSFSAGDGEFVVLVGPSGCGKSTALRLVAGLDEPEEGRILIDGADVRGVPPKARGCAMVFQSYALYPHWTVYENLAFPLRLRRTPKSEIERRVTAIAAELQLDAVLERRPKALSGGQRQRVALGRAMAADPSIFLFDEPLSNLDAPLRASMRVEIAARQRSLQRTTLYVTHDQAEALTMADRVIVLDRGRILGIGPPEELYRDPPNLFVATFLGRPAINLVSGHVRRHNESFILDPMGWNLPEDILAVAHLSDGHTVLAGVRAEHLRLVPVLEGPSGKILTREFLGDKILYSAGIGSQVITVLTEPMDRYELGTTVSIEPVAGQILLFEAGSGQRLA